jgi:Iodothyronine deiodinase
LFELVLVQQRAEASCGDYLQMGNWNSHRKLIADRHMSDFSDRGAYLWTNVELLQPGPKVGDEAPNFTLRSLKREPVSLSQEIGEKPIVLIFGNFTCGPFRRQAGNVEKLYNRYQGRAKFFVIYVREVHPKDGWWMLSDQRSGIDLLQLTVQRDRQEVA